MKNSKRDNLFYEVFLSADVVEEPTKATGQYCLYWMFFPVCLGTVLSLGVMLLLLIDYLFW